MEKNVEKFEGNENKKAKWRDRCSESEECSVIVDTAKRFPLVTIRSALVVMAL